MKMDSILSTYLNQPKQELGDRRAYIGASDVGQCPRKVVLSKVQPEQPDLQTLIRFERGNVVERIIEKAFSHAGIGYQPQLELQHPDYPFMAHLDFCFIREDQISVLEAKSVSKIPDNPYPSWLAQIHFQMGLAHMKYKCSVRGGILAMDLNSGEYQLFNGHTYNEQLFHGLVDRAATIWKALTDNVSPETEQGPLCVHCPYRIDCPEFNTDTKPHLPIEGIAMDYLSAKEQEKSVKAEVSRLRKELEVAVQPYGEATAGDYRLKLSTASRSGFDLSAFQDEYPDLAKTFTKISTYTRLYVS